MIYLDDVWYEYPNGVLGLKGVSLRIEGSSFVGGSTGSGKSTLLRTFNGLIPKFYGGKMRGTVRVEGKVFFIGQNAEEQIITSRVYDEMALPLLHGGYGIEEVDKRVKDVARSCGMEDLLEMETSKLSDGQKQLVVIATALASGSDILALDEPFANLHPDLAKRLIRLISKRTVVMAEHRLEYSEFFEEVIWMEDGRVSEPKDPPELECVRGKPGEVVVRVKDVTFGYDRPLFEGLSLEVRRGEIVAVVGRNGVGKTTLLKLIAGIYRPWDGEISVKGRVGISLAFPNYHLFEKEVRRETKMLEVFGLESLASRHPHSLSFGEAKRVAIAKAFERDVVLLDEPTAGQDSEFKARLLRVSRELGRAVVVATHDLEFAECCDEIVKLR